METAPDSSQQGAKHDAKAFHEIWRNLDRRQWWLWSWTVLVLILLTMAVASFAFPAILSREEDTYSFYLNQAVRALAGMVLVFAVYVIYQQTMIIRVRNELAEHMKSLAKVEDLTHEVYKLAAIDQLTGMYNRRFGEQRLEQEIHRAIRHQRPLTILMIDLDGLKQVNDRLGHGAGDLLLEAFSKRMQRAIRASDVAVRMGGDEFMAVLPECPVDEVRHVLGRLEGLSVEYSGERIRCEFSRGWTDYRPIETMQECLQRADDALYEDKRAGKAQEASAVQSPRTEPAV